jgi:hypothetical protein
MKAKAVTWKELHKSISHMPAEMQQEIVPAIRKNIYNNMAVIERMAEMLAYTPVSGTKPSLKTGGLRKTIERFANTKNPLKAYVVLGHKMRKGGGGNQAYPAYWSRFQIGGYAPGKRTAKELNAANQNGALSKSEAKEAIRRARRKSGNRFIKGKDYFGRTDGAATYRVEERAFAEALKQVDKMLESL